MKATDAKVELGDGFTRPETKTFSTRGELPDAPGLDIGANIVQIFAPFASALKERYEGFKNSNLFRNKFGCVFYSIALLLFVFFANSAHDYFFGNSGTSVTGIALCNHAMGEKVILQRGKTIKFRPVFDDRVSLDGELLDDRVVAVEGYRNEFTPENGGAAIKCKTLLVNRDRLPNGSEVAERRSSLCYEDQRKSDLAIAAGELDAEDDNTSARDSGLMVEVRRANGVVQYRRMMSCPEPAAPLPAEKLELGVSAQRVVEDWLNENGLPPLLRENGFYEGRVPIVLAFRNDRLVCEEAGGNAKSYKVQAVCEMIRDRAQFITGSVDMNSIDNKGQKVTIYVLDPDMAGNYQVDGTAPSN